MSRALRIAAAVLSLVCAGACVGPKQYRYIRNQPACFAPAPSDPMPGDPNERRGWPSIDCRNALFKVGFVEFDDQGRPFDTEQQKKVLELLVNEKRRAPDGKIITVVYVHGWKNNAAQASPGGSPKDVERFGLALTELGYRGADKATGEPGIPVVGVYIGWRGKSLKGPSWFNFMSYWSRRNAANRTGGQALADTVGAVVTATKAGSESSRVVVIGHSFGARVLEHAIDAGRLELYEEPQGQAAVTPLIDLVMYVNSANDARLSLKRIDDLRRQPLVVRHPDFDASQCGTAESQRLPICRAYPYIVTIMSKGDQATKYLLPLANTLNQDDRSVKAVVPTESFIDDPPSAGTFRKRSAGHIRFLQSHDVEETTCPVAGQPVCHGASCELAFRTWADDVCYAVRRRQPVDQKAPFNTTASWVMSVDTTVMKDHGDIWNLSMVSMLGQLMAPRGFFEPASQPASRPLQIRRAGN